ncbi:MAG: PLDc N-terminal domain-containing protein [Streptosporangiaceae bacterium]
MPAVLIPVLALAAAFVIFCLVDLARSGQKVLPKWAWAIVICGSVPLGGLAYLFVTKAWS